MPLDPLTTGVAKSALSAATKPTLDFLRKQLARRNAPFADLATLRGADKELDEAISVLKGTSTSLPSALLAKLKGFISDRPDSFASAEAKRFVEDQRVVDLIKGGARRTVRGENIDDERSRARVLHADMFGDDGIYGETLVEDAIAFATLTLIAHLTPADRQTIELMVDVRNEMRDAFGQIIGGLDALLSSINASPLDSEPYDDVIRAGTLKLRRQRMLQNVDLPDKAVAFGQKVETALRLASPDVRGEAYREIAALLIRADRAAEGEGWIEKAEALGADTTCERARIAMSKEQFDDALRMLRDRGDSLSRGLLMDAIGRRDGEEAALAYYDDHLQAGNLTGHALQVLSTRMILAGRTKDATALLREATDSQISENPVLLYIRARLSISQAVPPDVAKRVILYEGMLPRPTDLHDDTDGRRHLNDARLDLERLKPALPSLESPDFSILIDVNLVALGLCSTDGAAREIARTEFVERLKNPAQVELLAPLAKLYGVDVDWAPMKARLVQAKKLGGYDDTQLRAAFAMIMDEGTPSEIADFVHDYRERLELFSTSESIVAIEIEALAKSGRPEEAKALLAAERGTVGGSTATFLETTIAELQGADTVQMRLDQFEGTGSTHDLEVLIDVMRRRNDPRLGDYLVKLWRLRRQLLDAQRACEVLLRAGEELKAEAFLEELGEEARADPILRTHLAWARYREGRLDEAGAELAALSAMGVDDPNTRHLKVVLAIETGRWSELEAYVLREFDAREDRSAEELAAAARIASLISSPATMDLLRAATTTAPLDARIALQAYTIATEAGVERCAEVGNWLALAIADKERSGLVEKTDLNELMEIIASSQKEADRISGMINTASVPIFMGISAMGGTQSALVIRQMTYNAAETDSRRRSVVPLFAGNRHLRTDVRPKSISFDPLSILVLDQLGLLDTAIGAFDDVILPSGTLHSFFEDRGKAAHSQPSRVAQAKHIKNAVETSLLKIVDHATDAVSTDVDVEFATLFAAAEDCDGYLVDTCPLHPAGRLDLIVDPAPYARRLLSPTGLVTAMHASGVISRTLANAGKTMVAGSGEAFSEEPLPQRGKPLFLTNIAAQYLIDAGLLPHLKGHAGELFTSKQTIEFADREIASGTAADEIRVGIERVRATLARAITEGRARVGPARRMKDELERTQGRGDEIVRMSPVVSVLRDTAGIDAFVCDDRAMNKYVETTDRAGKNVAFLTTADLLSILRAVEVIDDDAVDAARERLRRSGAGMIPVDPDELRRAARDSDWGHGPNAELRAIRDSIHLPIARKVLQMPEERPWLRGVLLSIAYAIRNVWVEIEDEKDAEEAANWLLELLPDAAALSANDTSADREAWISEVTRSSLLAAAAIFDLPDRKVERYRRWFASRVEPLVGPRDPGCMEAVAQTLYAFMTAPLDVERGEDA